MYTTHRPQRFKYRMHRYYVGNVNQLHQLDLAIMSRFADYNDGVNYLLAQIDTFSRLAHVQPLKKKTAGEMVKALEKIYPDKSTYSLRVMSDRGKGLVIFVLNTCLYIHICVKLFILKIIIFIKFCRFRIHSSSSPAVFQG